MLPCLHLCNKSIATIEKYQSIRNNSDWSSFDDMTSLDEGWSLIHRIYIEALNVTAPHETLYLTYINIWKRKSWTTPELMQAIRNNLKISCAPFLNNSAHTQFKKIRNKVKRDVIKAKRSFIMSKINNSRNNP